MKHPDYIIDRFTRDIGQYKAAKRAEPARLEGKAA